MVVTNFVFLCSTRMLVRRRRRRKGIPSSSTGPYRSRLLPRPPDQLTLRSGFHYYYFVRTAHRGLWFIFYYCYSITVCVWSAAPQTTLWGGPGPRFEPGTGCLEAETLTTRPPHLPPPLHYTIIPGSGRICVSFEWSGFGFFVVNRIRPS